VSRLFFFNSAQQNRNKSAYNVEDKLGSVALICFFFQLVKKNILKLTKIYFEMYKAALRSRSRKDPQNFFLPKAKPAFSLKFL
jgi:hypothetical protein